MKVTAWLDNESDAHERFDLHVEVIGLGKVGRLIAEYAVTGEPVILEGELNAVRAHGSLLMRVSVSTLRRVEVAA